MNTVAISHSFKFKLESCQVKCRVMSHAQKGLLRYQREIHVSLCIVMKCWAMAWGAAGTTYYHIHD